MQNYETFSYDNLHRLTDSDRAYSSESRPNDAINYTYNQLGNITLKDDYLSSASYGNAAKSLGGNAGPNAIRQITYAGGGTTNYTYDNNGNMLTGDGRTMTYNEFNKPLTIAKGGVTSTFSYGANLLRYKQIKTGLTGGTQTTYHIDRLMEIEKQGTRTTYRHYIDGVAVLNREDVGSTTTWKLGFHLKDRLGSVVTLADQDGTVLEHRSYDPFGKPRRGDFIDATAGTIQAAIAEDPHPEDDMDPLTDRGFTDHEHLDEQQVIHMNGRVFDYNVGRFSSVDPYIQYPYLSQSLNPYSYIMNNPLAGTDPSGYVGVGEKLQRVDEIHDPTYERDPYAFGDSDNGNGGSDEVVSTDGVVSSTATSSADGSSSGRMPEDEINKLMGENSPRKSEREINEKGNEVFHSLEDGVGTVAEEVATSIVPVARLGKAPGLLKRGWVKIKNLLKRTPKVTLQNPYDIRFSQNSISQKFRNGEPVDGMIENLRNGSLSADNVDPIRIFERDGKFYSLDNRRLYAFQEAGKPIRTVQATAEEVANEALKFTTKTDGVDIVVRGSNR